MMKEHYIESTSLLHRIFMSSFEHQPTSYRTHK